MAPAPSSGGPRSDDEPLYLSAIDLGGRIVIGYFAVVFVGLAVDMLRGDRLVFRSWASFAIQAAAAFLLAALVARRTLLRWQEAGSGFVPARISSSAVVIAAALGLGTLAGGFFPDAASYQRRAPEMFVRSVVALVPAAIAVYVVLRSAARSRPAPAPVQDPPLTGVARDAAIRALDVLNRGEEALSLFHQHAAAGRAISTADAERLWVALDGPGFVAHLRQLPPDHAVTKALREAGVAQTDAAYLIALASGAHGVIGHTAESARELVDEVAARRGRPEAGAAELAALSRTLTMEHRDLAAGLLHASRFGPPFASV
jgi:hypothetical protein